MTSSETGLHSREGTVGFEMISDLITWPSKNLERQGRMDIGLYQFGFRVSPPLKRGMTVAAVQSLGSSDDTKERVNRLVIGVATMAADSFRTRGARLASPADLYGSKF